MGAINPDSVKSRMSLAEIENRSLRRKKKGRKRKGGWEKLRERRILGIGTLRNGGLVSDNDTPTRVNGKPGRTVTATGGGLIPGIFNGNPNPPNMPGGLTTKSLEEKSEQYSPRDNDTDVFIDIESARRRARQLGCIGVSRRISKSGKIVWMPCTNMTDYNNSTGMSSLGRLNQAKKTQKVIRTVISGELKKRKKSIAEEILGKSIGPKLSGSARFAARTIVERFDPNAEDGDGDGLLQDGTAFERPNVPGPKIAKRAISEIGKTTKPGSEKEITPEDISAVKNWIDKNNNLQKISQEPIEAFDVRRSTRGFASTSGPAKREPVTIEGLDNPEASPTNPFRNLGGKKMGEIIRGFVKPKSRGKKQRTTYLIGGTTGGGKSTVLDEHLVPNGIVPGRDEAAHVDPDFIKLGLPGYSDGAGAPVVHDESLRAAQHTIDDARNDGMDVVATGAGSTRQRAMIAEARRNGDRVVAHWVHVSQPEASRRLKEREKNSGRKIPDQTDHFARSIPKMVSSAVSNGEVDEFYIWDNEVEQGQPPRLIASFKGGKLEIHDKKKLDEFMNGHPLKPKSPDSELTEDTSRAMSKPDEFSGFASSSSSKKKKGGRYTPPKKRTPATRVVPGRTQAPSPFGTQPGTGAQTSLINIPNFGAILEAKRTEFAQRLLERVMFDKNGNPKDHIAYISEKLKRMISSVTYLSQGGQTGQPVSISALSLRSKLDSPAEIKRIADIYAPVRRSNETVEEFADRVMATIPVMQFAKISSTPIASQMLRDALIKIGYDTNLQKKVRKLLEDELTNNPAFAELVKEFGLPLIVGGNKDLNGKPLVGTAAFHSPGYGMIVLSEKSVDAGGHEAIGSTVDSRKFDTVEGTLRHEWFHYLDAVILASDKTARDKRLLDYASGLQFIVSNPEGIAKRVLGATRDELVRNFESRIVDGFTAEMKKRHPNYSDEQARIRAIEFIKTELQRDRQQFITVLLPTLLDGLITGDDVIQDIFRDRGGIYDNIAKKYSAYSRYGVHELIAEIGRMITSTAGERNRPDSNIATIDSTTIDFLVSQMPTISRAMWIRIVKMAFPGIQIKRLVTQ